jgi:glycerophosphoryl diester phosphodiesterase
MESYYLERPLVMAHRGAKDVAPENTLAAFEAAHDLGADAIELDVTRCATGEIIVLHDDTVERTTNGTGRAEALPLDALRALDAGSWFDAHYAGERLPLLEEVLAQMGHRVRFNIEIKGRSLSSDGIEAEVAAMLRRHGLVQETIISSFNPAALWRMRRAAPELGRGLLYAGDMPLALRRAWGRHLVKPQALHPHYGMVDAVYVAWAHRKGYRVNVWTVNEPDDIRRMADLGVDAIITDPVAETRRLLGL